MMDDFTEDPVVDLELRDFIQEAAVQPTVEEKERFWVELEQKLDTEPTAPAEKPTWLSRLPLKAYFPLAAACAAVALFIVLPTQRTEKVFTSIESELQGVQQEQTENQSEPPMVLGAAPEADVAPDEAKVQRRARSLKPSDELSDEASKPQEPAALRELSEAQRQALDAADAEWEQINGVYEVHIPVTKHADFLKQLQYWPNTWRVTPLSVQQKMGYKSYRVDFKAPANNGRE